MKIKLTAIYICILIALSTVGYISFHGLTNIMNALRLAVQPDGRLMQITEFVNLLHSGENYMRLYSITRINDYRLAHEQNMNGMQEHLNRLYIASEDDPEIVAGLDSIKLSLVMKMYYHDQMIRLKSISILPLMMPH